jgi:hypothetical protein
MIDARMTDRPGDPVHAGVLHKDGAVSLVKVEVTPDDAMHVTVEIADGHRVVIHDER